RHSRPRAGKTQCPRRRFYLERSKHLCLFGVGNSDLKKSLHLKCHFVEIIVWPTIKIICPKDHTYLLLLGTCKYYKLGPTCSKFDISWTTQRSLITLIITILVHVHSEILDPRLL
ncbi:hypothetical protein H8959_014267, partial [Pygathrix nigripes]